MEDLDRFITSTKSATDLEIENSLRPRAMKDYVGQEKIKKNLELDMEKMRGHIRKLNLSFGMRHTSTSKSVKSFFIFQEGTNI